MRRTSLHMVHELAHQDARIIFIGSDLGPGTMEDFKAEHPDRYFMEGVAEMNLIGMAAGMALEGFVPYVNTIATFLTRRCYEQVAIDICLHNLPVRMLGNGGGLVYAPLGPTHLATDDIAIMRVLPNMCVVAPSDAEEMRAFMLQTPDYPGPIYIRLGKGNDPVIHEPGNEFVIGKGIIKAETSSAVSDALLVSTGVMTRRCLEAAIILEERGVTATVLHLPTIKPLDEELLLILAQKAKLVVTVEEHTVIGGLGSAVLDCLAFELRREMPQVLRLGLPDKFAEVYGSQDQQLSQFGLDSNGIVREVEGFREAEVAPAFARSIR
ncbi:MAG: transketolase [Gammaproteobacteria bacterium TMED34]|nr:MAG: transketolase [Gammaproteobacteria bacterium TMED34]